MQTQERKVGASRLNSGSMPESADARYYEWMQDDQRIWVEHNFGGRAAWQPLVGMYEEIGEMVEASMKGDLKNVKDAIGDIQVYMADFCSCTALPFQEIVDRGRTLIKNGALAGESNSVRLQHWMQIHLGAASHAFLKAEQGIRGTREEHQAALQESLTWFWVSLDRYVAYGPVTEDTEKCLRDVWAVVRQRDWRKDRFLGGTQNEQ